MRYSFIAHGLLRALLLTTIACSAQAQTRVNVSRAIELENAAAVAQTDLRRWGQAASLLREAASLRPDNDPVALTDLRNAGAIYGTLGDMERARTTVLDLAERAAAFGEVAMAAHAFMDAAHVAFHLRDVESVRSFYARAQRLAMSSHLTSEERRVLTHRLQASPTLYASAAQ